jgi:hypothetical protein
MFLIIRHLLCGVNGSPFGPATRHGADRHDPCTAAADASFEGISGVMCGSSGYSMSDTTGERSFPCLSRRGVTSVNGSTST